MATICPKCHLAGNRVEMTSRFLRWEEQRADIPCDTYPDGTVARHEVQPVDAPVYGFACAACGLTTEGMGRAVERSVPESP